MPLALAPTAPPVLRNRSGATERSSSAFWSTRCLSRCNFLSISRAVCGHFRAQELERDRAIQLRVERAINLAHPARADERVDLVTSDARSGFNTHGCAGCPSVLRKQTYSVHSTRRTSRP